MMAAVFDLSLWSSVKLQHIVDVFPLEDLLTTELLADDQPPDDPTADQVGIAMSSPPTADAAVRLKLLKPELPDEQMPKDATLADLSCAINVKEKVEIDGEFSSTHPKSPS